MFCKKCGEAIEIYCRQITGGGFLRYFCLLCGELHHGTLLPRKPQEGTKKCPKI